MMNEVYRLTSEKRGWVENIPLPVFSTRDKGKHFITIAPVRDGSNGFFDHLVLVDMNNRRSHPITFGSFDVIKINTWDEERKLVYFTAIPASHPGERRLYRLKVDQPYTEQSPICISCKNEEIRKNETIAIVPGVVSNDGSSGSSGGERKKSTRKSSQHSSSHEEKPPQGKFSNFQVGGGGEKKQPKGSTLSAGTAGNPSGSDGGPGTGNSRGPGVVVNVDGNRDLLQRDKSCSFVSDVKFSKAKSYFVVECAGPDVPFVLACSSSEKEKEVFHHRGVADIMMGYTQNPSSIGDGVGGFSSGTGLPGEIDGIHAELPHLNNPFSNTPFLNVLTVLQNNDELLDRARSMAFPQVRTFAVHMMAGHTVQVRLLLPPGLREDEITRYPLILNVYGGPGTQLAIERWGVDFATYLAGRKDYIVAQIDGRGSGGRGWHFQHQVYYKIGLYEVADQIEVIRFLRDSLDFVEPKKIGVWGWSYGGFLTAMIMASKDSKDVFKCGASVAPVSSWRMYDSAYTERYMGKPNVTDNYRGYADSDVTQNVDEFGNKMFYLVHGTADDNVHLQHSMLLAKALIQKNILFRQQLYPDESHGLNGVKFHVHKSLENFFEDCFRKQSPPELGTGLNRGGNVEEFEE